MLRRRAAYISMVGLIVLYVIMNFELGEISKKGKHVTQNQPLHVPTSTATKQPTKPFLLPINSNFVPIPENPLETGESGLNTSHILLLRQNKVPYCIEDDTETTHQSKSSCYYTYPQEIYCRSKDLAIDLNHVHILEIWDGKPLPHLELEITTNTFHLESESCPNPQSLQHHLVRNGFIWEYSPEVIFRTFASDTSWEGKTCDGRWSDDLVYLVTRYDYVNVYHTTLDLFVMWFTAQLYEIPGLDQLQVVFFDAKVPGSLDHLWEKLTGKPALRVTDMKNSGVDVLCYRDSIFSCPSNNSRWFEFLKLALFMVDEMDSSELWMGFREFVRDKFRINHLNSFVHNSNPTITLILRADYQKTGRTSLTKRKFGDDNEMIDILKQLNNVNIHVVELSTLSWQQQISLMAQTDILIGVHGAGLTQLLYLPDNSFVFELSAQQYTTRVHFRLLSRWLDHLYYNYYNIILDMDLGIEEDIWIPAPSDLLTVLKGVVHDVRKDKCSKPEANCDREEPGLFNPPIVL